MICKGETILDGADLHSLVRSRWLVDCAPAGWVKPLPASFVVGMPWRLINGYLRAGKLVAVGPQETETP